MVKIKEACVSWNKCVCLTLVWYEHKFPWNLRIHHSSGNPPLFHWNLQCAMTQVKSTSTVKRSFREPTKAHYMWYSLCSSFFFRISCCSSSLFSSSISLCLCSMFNWKEKKRYLHWLVCSAWTTHTLHETNTATITFPDKKPSLHDWITCVTWVKACDKSNWFVLAVNVAGGRSAFRSVHLILTQINFTCILSHTKSLFMYWMLMLQKY